MAQLKLPLKVRKPSLRNAANKLEKHIQAGILHYLNLVPDCIAFQIYNGAVFDQRQGHFRANNNKFRPKGIPDIIGSIRGVPLGIEVKTKTGRLSPEQIRMHEILKFNGWIVGVCRSIEDAQTLIL